MVYMKNLKVLKKQKVTFKEEYQVQEGVMCYTFVFDNDSSKDAAIIVIQKGYKSPRQRIMNGDKTIQGWFSGKAVLTVKKPNGETVKYNYPGAQNDIEVQVGEIMEWEALEDLMYYEICYPPYKEGRFEDL